jgi:hypothetical protein
MQFTTALREICPEDFQLGHTQHLMNRFTRTAFDAYVTVPPNVSGQDEAGRLWDVVWMLRFAVQRSRPGCDRLPFALYVRNDNRAARLVKLIAACGALDMDDPQPAITVMMPDED